MPWIRDDIASRGMPLRLNGNTKRFRWYNDVGVERTLPCTWCTNGANCPHVGVLSPLSELQIKMTQRPLFFFAKLWFTFFLSSFSFSLLLLYIPSNMSPATVPCKYKTGKILGSGTYATVKGKMKTDKPIRFHPSLPITSLRTHPPSNIVFSGTLWLHWSSEAMHVSLQREQALLSKHSFAVFWTRLKPTSFMLSRLSTRSSWKDVNIWSGMKSTLCARSLRDTRTSWAWWITLKPLTTVSLNKYFGGILFNILHPMG